MTLGCWDSDVWGPNVWGANVWAAGSTVTVTDVSSLSLVNIAGLSSGNGLGTDELDAVYVGKGKRP